MTAQHDAQLDVCKEKWKAFEQHAKESIPIRDCVKELEYRVKTLERGVMWNAVIGGLIGALIGSGAAPAINALVSFFIKIN